jgi:DNA-binding NarL/FixJ family response regulator
LHVVSLCRGAHERPIISSERARQTFDALGATAWGRPSRGTLRVVGFSSRTTPDVSEPLTAQESRVAHLAAYGLSNKDIGERLFLSPRTVSGHLYRLFPKLGITSRAGLRDALQRRDEATARVMETG